MDAITKIRGRETERRDFTATVDCPRCGIFAVHWLAGRRLSGVVRKCRECGHEWNQG